MQKYTVTDLLNKLEADAKKLLAEKVLRDAEAAKLALKFVADYRILLDKDTQKPPGVVSTVSGMLLLNGFQSPLQVLTAAYILGYMYGKGELIEVK